MNDILIVKVGKPMMSDTMEKLRKKFIEQMKDGVVMLPCFCDALLIPRDAEVQMEQDGDLLDICDLEVENEPET